ncbi:hypothetical protein D7X96_39070 [Corallococcus interemptor]|uniref:Transposase n=1 Tax=Corallococcus interemptor TaxID=2316720 RepID=A0A3A8PPL6_9BACT|nr:hypothetical protein D7X96_39070 [Corallococcus interemptor]
MRLADGQFLCLRPLPIDESVRNPAGLPQPPCSATFALPASVRVVLAVEPVDMRKSIDGLMTLVRGAWGEDVYSGHLFAFPLCQGSCRLG